MAYDDGYYFGLAKVIALASADSDNGKTVTVTNGTKTWTGTMADGKCAFSVPGNDVYTLRIGANSCSVDISYGECAEVYVPAGKKDIAETQAKYTADITAAKNELQTNFQAGVDSIYDAVVAKGTTPASKALAKVVEAITGMKVPTKFTVSISVLGAHTLPEQYHYDITININTYLYDCNDALIKSYTWNVCQNLQAEYWGGKWYTRSKTENI